MKKGYFFLLMAFCVFFSCSNDEDGSVQTNRLLPILTESAEGEDKPEITRLQYDSQDRITKIDSDNKQNPESSFSCTISYYNDNDIEKVIFTDKVYLFLYKENVILRYEVDNSNTVLNNWKKDVLVVDESSLPVPDTLWLNAKKQLVKYASSENNYWKQKIVDNFEYDSKGNITKESSKFYIERILLGERDSSYKYDNKNGTGCMIKTPQWYLVLSNLWATPNNMVEASHIETEYGTSDRTNSYKGYGTYTYNEDNFPQNILVTFTIGSPNYATIKYEKR